MDGITIELALIRWSVKCRKWDELATAYNPYLPAFLSGWFARQCGMPHPPTLGRYKDSWRVGWKECDEQIMINERASRHCDGTCEFCNQVAQVADSEAGKGASQ